MYPDNWSFDSHGLDQAIARNISEIEVAHILRTGEVIESHPSNIPLPKELILGFYEGRPIHLVVYNINFAQRSVVYTAYEVDFSKWYPDCKTRRPKQ